MQNRRRGFVKFLSIRPMRRNAPRLPLESLESRRMLCIDHVLANGPVVEEQTGQGRAAAEGGEPANIIWTNRATTTAAGTGDTDGFGARFGASAPIARGVVDAVIESYERMIGSFNYPTAGAAYNLVVNMGASGSGFGASANLGSSLGGKPKSGTITMSAGNGSANPDDDNGWFLDPTPGDSAEFLGAIVNAYSGNASASTATGRGDFYTVLAAELTHCLGLFGDALPGWEAMTTDTGIVDTAEAGGRGTYWVFDGPSVKHLLTSNNGGSGGSDFGMAIHSAGPGGAQPITFNGQTYVGAQDQGNAVYEFGRRYTVNNIFALMFKDAYGFSTADPARDGTFYSIHNQTTGLLTVRGAASSDDLISITRSGDTLAVSVDIRNDVPGTGHLPGAGDLPAFVSYYDIADVTSILVAGDSGNDTITLDASLNLSASISGGAGTDTVVVNGDAGTQDIGYTIGSAITLGANTVATNTIESLLIDAGDGTDGFTVRGTAGADSLVVSGSAITGGPVAVSYANVESLSIFGQAGADTITLAAPTIPSTVTADGSTDTLLVTETLSSAPVTIAAATGLFNLSVNTDARGVASVIANSPVGITELSLATGGTISGAGALTIGSVFSFAGGSVEGSGALIVSAGASMNVDGPGLKTLGRNLSGAAFINIAEGTLRLADGLSTSVPAITASGLTLGANAKLDLTDNALVIDYDSVSPLATLASSLASGFAAGAWTGPGISSSAAASAGRTIGFGEAAGLSGLPTFFAEGDATRVLIRYTVAGDANLDGSVNFDDLLITAQSYGQAGKSFAQGNYDFDLAGNVNFDDLLLLAQNYGGALVTAPVATTTTRRTAGNTSRTVL